MSILSLLLLSFIPSSYIASFFFFNDTATTEIYTLSLHDALPICPAHEMPASTHTTCRSLKRPKTRSEEHTSELQSQFHLVCRLLLEKKKKNTALLLSLMQAHVQCRFNCLIHRIHLAYLT